MKQEIVTLTLAIVVNKDELSVVNSIGLCVCLGGISLHVGLKAARIHRENRASASSRASASHSASAADAAAAAGAAIAAGEQQLLMMDGLYSDSDDDDDVVAFDVAGRR